MKKSQNIKNLSFNPITFWVCKDAEKIILRSVPMKRSGFTLIELIFVMVVIGVLAAVALPKFKGLKDNAVVTNLVANYTNAVQNAPASYLNATELNDLTPADVNISTLIKIPGNVQPWESDYKKRKGWYEYTPSSHPEDIVYYYPEYTKYIEFYYYNNGKLLIRTNISGTNKEKIKALLTKRLGLTWNGDKNDTIIDLTDND